MAFTASNSTIREEVENLRRHQESDLRAGGDSLARFLASGDKTAIKRLKPLLGDMAFRRFVQAAWQLNDPDQEKVLDFVALAMCGGERTFPVVPSTRPARGGAHGGWASSVPTGQSPAEDFAALFLDHYLAQHCSEAEAVEARAQRLLEATERMGVDEIRRAAFLLSIREKYFHLSFGWKSITIDEENRYLGWGLNAANFSLSPPSSVQDWSALETAIWQMNDGAFVELLRRQADARLRFKWLHGTLACQRPTVLEGFLAEAASDETGILHWLSIVRATGQFDRQAIAHATRSHASEGLPILVVIDSLRPGTCPAQAIEMVFREEVIPDETGLCYVRDRHPDRLSEYVSKMLEAGAKKLGELTRESVVTSYRDLGSRWSNGGRDLTLATLALRSVDGRERTATSLAFFQTYAFEGLLAAEPLPPAGDLREALTLGLQAVEASELDDNSKLDACLKFYQIAVERHPECFQEQLWELLNAHYKMARDLAIDGLAKLPANAVVERASELLAARKADIRISAATLLARMADPQPVETLQAALEREKSEKVRTALHAALEACGASQTSGNEDAVNDLEPLRAEIAAAADRLRMPKTDLTGLSQLPTLRFTNDEELPQAAVTYLLAKQAKHKEIAAAPDLFPLLAHIDRNRSGDFSLALVERFLDSDQATSDRWALALGGLLGDQRVIPPLLSRIQDWCEKSRHKLAEYAAQAISLLPGDEPLMVLDALATRYRNRFKNVGRACAEAFQAAATARGITPDELGDMVVPRFDFDDDCFRRFDWEGGSLCAELSPDFKLVWFDPETEKVWKSLPKSVPETVKAEIKTLSKLLRETVKGQTVRLELALVRQRRWPVGRWRELYENHPILRSFASRLVWGVYDSSGHLLRGFRRYSNGLLADAAGALEELEEPDVSIGMVHPLEMDEPELEAWRAHLARMKVEAPFPQLERAVERLDPLHGNRRELTISREKHLGAGTFKSRSDKRGWVRGSVVDAGGISSVYKPYPGAAIEAILPTDGYYVGIDPMDTVKLGAAYFVKADSVDRGSYTYDEPSLDDPRVLRFDQVPAVVYSETVADLKAIIGEQA